MEDRIVGRKIEEIFDIYSETDNCKVAIGLPKSWGENQYYNKEYYAKMRTQSGAEIPIEYSISPIKDSKSKITGMVIVFRDYTVKKKKQEKIEYMSYHDPLTGIYNRRYFDEQIIELDKEEKISSIITDSDSNMYSNKITESAIFKKNTIIDFRNALENKHSMTLEDKLRTKKICDVAMIEMGIKGDE